MNPFSFSANMPRLLGWRRDTCKGGIEGKMWNNAKDKLPRHRETSIYTLVRLDRFRFYSLLLGVSSNGSAIVREGNATFIHGFTRPIHRLASNAQNKRIHSFFYRHFYRDGDGHKRGISLKFIRFIQGFVEYRPFLIAFTNIPREFTYHV